MDVKKLLSKDGLKVAMEKSKYVAKEKAPTLMIIGAAAGLCGTVYLALVAKPKADEILETRAKKLAELEGKSDPEEEILDEEKDEKPVLTEEEKKEERWKINLDAGVKMVKVVFPPFVMGVTTIGLMFGANYINLKRLADATALYDISSSALRRYKEKTKEVLGENKAADVKNAVAQSTIDDTYRGDKVLNSGQGDDIFLDYPTGRYFRSTRAAVDRAFADVMMALSKGDEFISCNDLYFALDIPHSECGFGEKNGWMPGYCEPRPEYSYASTHDGHSCTVIDYDYMKRFRFGDE